jgi:hypothetical protein
MRWVARLLVVGTVLMPSVEARAKPCRDMGGIGVVIGGLAGLGFAVVNGFAGPAIAVSVDSTLTYSEGVAISMAGGVATAIGGAALAAGAFCEFPTSIWLPITTAVVGGVGSTVLWGAVAAKGEARPSTAALTSTPRFLWHPVALRF